MSQQFEVDQTTILELELELQKAKTFGQKLQDMMKHQKTKLAELKAIEKRFKDSIQIMKKEVNRLDSKNKNENKIISDLQQKIQTTFFEPTITATTK